MKGLVVRITNISAGSLTLGDLPDAPTLGAGEVLDVTYLDDVQNSLEYGTLNAYLSSNPPRVSCGFLNGSLLAQAQIGATYRGASPSTAGAAGLVPPAAASERLLYLRGDGTWGTETASSIGAIPASVMTATGDLITRNPVGPIRLPAGTAGQSLRMGPTYPTWTDESLSGAFADRPVPSALYSGRLYYATDTPALYVCHYDGAAWVWRDTALYGPWDTFPTGGVPGFLSDITHPGRAAVGVDPAGAIPAGVQFQVEGATSVETLYVSEMVEDADLAGSSQLRVDATDRGLYVKPEGRDSRRVDLPGLTRKAIDGELIIIPDGSQYICYGSFVLSGAGVLQLDGDADLVVL